MWTNLINKEIKEIHCIPTNDSKEHIEGDCWCKPRLTQENGWNIWIHNAQDKREYFEPGTEKITKVIN